MQREEESLAMGQRAEGRAQEEVQEPVLGRGEAARGHPVQGWEEAPAYLLVEADSAWAKVHQGPWISCLVADPTCSPRPKGGETTLEPYLTLAPSLRRCAMESDLTQTVPNPSAPGRLHPLRAW